MLRFSDDTHTFIKAISKYIKYVDGKLEINPDDDYERDKFKDTDIGNIYELSIYNISLYLDIADPLFPIPPC